MAQTRMSADERRTQLLDVAEELFTSHGLGHVSIEDIARAAGVSRPIVYQHHHSKDELFLACVRRATDEFDAQLLKAHRLAAGDLDDFILRGGDALFDLLVEQPSRWSLLFSGFVGDKSEVAGELVALRLSTVETLARIVGEYAPHLQQEQTMAFAHGVAGLSEAFCRWYRVAPDVPRERVLTYYREFITGAMAQVGTTLAPLPA